MHAFKTIVVLAIALSFGVADRAAGQTPSTPAGHPSSASDPDGLESSGPPLQQASVDVSFMSNHPPDYPRSALSRGIEGAVSLLVLVDPDGNPAAIQIEYPSGNKDLDATAVAAAWHWRFHPELHKGMPRTSIARVPVVFKLGLTPKRPREDLPGGTEIYPETNRALIAQLERSATEGSVHAQFLMANLTAYGLGVTKDAAASVQWYLKEVAQGDSSAFFPLSRIYAMGWGVSADGNAAIAWLQKGVAAGSINAQDAQLHFGLIYARGYGIPKDPAKATEWFERAAAQGNAQMKLRIAYIFGVGDGVAKDTKRCMDLLDQSAEQGDDDIKLRVASIYFRGDMVPTDMARSAKLTEAAAAHGSLQARKRLASMYATGRGENKDMAKAIDLMQHAAAEGDFESQRSLSQAYFDGKDIEKDDVLGYAWLILAVNQGKLSYTTDLDQKRKNMQSDDVSEATRLASAWVTGQVLAREPKQTGARHSP